MFECGLQWIALVLAQDASGDVTGATIGLMRNRVRWLRRNRQVTFEQVCSSRCFGNLCKGK